MDECMKSFILSLLILSTTLASSLHAQGDGETGSATNKTVYVTDALQLKLNSAKNSEGNELDSLQSGDALILLEDQGTYSMVRTEKGTEGWVTSFYLTERIPTQHTLRGVQSQLAERDASIRQLKEQLQNMTPERQANDSQNPGLLAELESKVVLLNQQNVMMTNDKEQLRKQLVQAELAIKHSEPETNEETTGLMRFFDKLPFTFPLYAWLGIALGIGSILGFALGYSYYSNKLKKRFYGFRI